MFSLQYFRNTFNWLCVQSFKAPDEAWVNSFSDGGIHEVFVSSKSWNIWNALQEELEENLGIKWIKSLTLHRNYLVQGLDDTEFDLTVKRVLSEAPVDNVSNKADFISENKNNEILVIESAPGQFDARVDAVDKNISLVTGKTDIQSRYKNVISFEGKVSAKDMKKIKNYLINPNEKTQSDISDKEFERKIADPVNHIVLEGFTDIDSREWFKDFLGKHDDIAIEIEDIEMVRDYFRDTEQRDPTKVELLLIGTYWSDHCRHTTFETQIENVTVSGVQWFVDDFKKFRQKYKEKNEEIGKEWDSFMQLAKSSLRFLKDDPEFQGDLIDESLEDNAASFKLKIKLDNGEEEDWIFMFKNETHNSPTNSEPFGGAATCLGWAIRDTLSGRAFTFAAQRVTWAGDPTEAISDTVYGAVSQRALSIGAALWYASYGNQIGLAATQVREYFHPGYKAKRFEMGIVMAAVKEENLIRSKPENGDLIIQFWWPVWRDGIGWATVSSMIAGSLDDTKMGAHVQKWNPVEERKFQRLMCNPAFIRLIKKSNDFGAGGVAVALWELSRGVSIDLDAIAKHSKYDGLNDEELMIAESQERMSIVISPENKEAILKFLREANIVWFVAGEITDDIENPENDRLVVTYKDKKIVDLSRDFLDESGVERKHNADVKLWKVDFFESLDPKVQKHIQQGDFTNAFRAQLWLLITASQRWLESWFDNSVWASTIHAPYGWKHQTSPQAASVSKVPTFDGVDSKTAIVSANAFNPYLLSENTYVGWMYTILETVSKIVATWGKHRETWFSLQEYFGKLTSDEKYWEVYAGLLGTLKVLLELKIAAIGWKDSMSGSQKLGKLFQRIKDASKKSGWKAKWKAFKDLALSLWKREKVIDVPPTIVWVANAPVDSSKAVSSEFKQAWSSVLCFPIKRDVDGLPDIASYAKNLETIEKLIDEWKVLASSVVGQWWLAHTITNMCLWNKIWFEFEEVNDIAELFTPNLWDIILEVKDSLGEDFAEYFIWKTADHTDILYGINQWLKIEDAQKTMDETLNWVWNTDKGWENVVSIEEYREKKKHEVKNILGAKAPVALIPVFPGTNSELDTKHALLKEWFEVIEHVFIDTWTPEEQAESRRQFAELLKKTQMLVVPGWFSWWDEPGASGIWAVNVLKSAEIRDPLQEFLDKEHTLTLGICNGAQILNKLWVMDNGQIKEELWEEDTIIKHNDRLNHETGLVRNVVKSILSPFFREENLGEEYLLNVSHGEWNFQMTDEKYQEYLEKGQIALQYTDEEGRETNKFNGSHAGIAGMTSPDGRIAILMPHIERTGLNVMKNVPGEKLLPMFRNARMFFEEWGAEIAA